jgi:hypothetical protein
VNLYKIKKLPRKKTSTWKARHNLDETVWMEQLYSPVLLAQSFQFYNSIGTVPFSEELSHPVSIASLWQYDHSITVSLGSMITVLVSLGSMITVLQCLHVQAACLQSGVTVDNTEQSAL